MEKYSQGWMEKQGGKQEGKKDNGKWMMENGWWTKNGKRRMSESEKNWI